jgi:hypothetical protein
MRSSLHPGGCFAFAGRLLCIRTSSGRSLSRPRRTSASRRDLPKGWKGTPHKTDPSNAATQATLAKCVGVRNTYPDKVASAHSRDFALGVADVHAWIGWRACERRRYRHRHHQGHRQRQAGGDLPGQRWSSTPDRADSGRAGRPPPMPPARLRRPKPSCCNPRAGQRRIQQRKPERDTCGPEVFTMWWDAKPLE